MTGKTCLGSATLGDCGLMVIALVSGYQEVWVQALARDIAVFWDTTLHSRSASLSTQVYK